MHDRPNNATILAYETQVRYAAADDWIMIAVSASHRTAVSATLCHRDAWGRIPIESRVVPANGNRAA